MQWRARGVLRQRALSQRLTHRAFDQVPRGCYLASQINAVGINNVNDRPQPETEETCCGLNRGNRFRIAAARARDQIQNRERTLLGVPQAIWIELGQIPPKITREGSEV